jgi:hypothetical protein
MTATPNASSERTESWLARAARLCWLGIIVATVLVSAAWWWLEPGGFEISHPRFWANSVAPIVALGLSLATLGALRSESRRALKWFLLLWPAAALGTAVSGRLLFPVTLAWLWLIPLGGSLVMGLAVLRFWSGESRRTRAGSVGLGLLVALASAAFVRTQYPPTPRTKPTSQVSISFTRENRVQAISHPISLLRLARNADLHTLEGSLLVRFSQVSISANPMLRFLNSSKDGCWSVFASARDQVGPEPRLREAQFDGEHSCRLAYDLPGQGPATMRVEVDPSAESIKLEVRTNLMQTTYSHLNSYSDFEIRGHRLLELEFSPCLGVPIEVRKFDYPIGRPARFAYVEQDRTFRIVEAASGEKGPFLTLARGHLGAEESLTIILRDFGRPVGKITLADWAAQADTTLSPTAGWGVPVNAIEFNLADDPPSSPASIFVTLAGTSVGRGWDCVGHNPGTYRNRILLEAVVDQSSEENDATDRSHR